MNQVTINRTPLKSANSFKIAKNKLYFVLSIEQITCILARKNYALCFRFFLRKNGSGLIDIMHIEVERKTSSNEVIE